MGRTAVVNCFLCTMTVTGVPKTTVGDGGTVDEPTVVEATRTYVPGFKSTSKLPSASVSNCVMNRPSSECTITAQSW